jgi:hypothetical protein
MRTPKHLEGNTLSSKITRRWLVAAAIAAVAVSVPVGLQVAGQGTASASTVPNATVVSTTPVFDSNAVKTADAQCPAGKRVIGGGARVNGAQHVVITQQQPISTGAGDTFRASASEDQFGFAGNWALQAFAICSNPLSGLAIVSTAGTAGSGSFQGVSATCPAGKRALGTGGRIDGGQGQVQLGTIAEGSLGSNRSTATGTEDPDGFNGTWNVTAFTVCVTSNTITDFQVVQNQSASNNTARKIINVSCPSGKHVTGAAAFTSTPGNVEVVAPDAFRTNVQAIGRSDNVGVATWDVHVYAFCTA